MSKPQSILTIKDLVDHGFSYVDFDNNDLISRVLIGWDNFLQEPDFYKDWWHDLSNFKKDIGYQSLGKQAESIEIFKANYGLNKLVKENGFDYKKYLDWIFNLNFLRTACKELCLSLTESLCHEFDYDFFRLHGNLVKNYFLNLQKYPPTEEDFSVNPHQDKNFLTIQLFAGSEIFLFGKDCQVPYLVPNSDKVLVFFGTSASALFPKLKAMTHGIKNYSSKPSLAISFSIG